MDTRLKRTMDHWVAQGYNSVQYFNEAVEESGITYALEWRGDAMFKHGAKADLAKSVIAILESGTTLEQMVEHFTQQLTEQMQVQSTSTCSNFAAVMKRNAVAELVRDIKFLTS